ncbi:MAG: 50S ribosomal protein L25 [Candidatus Omnitrophica bacterium]|nr:50S ribosomal protein L25 [Candidatus Omnitrophota bacterium]MDD5436974.1 50S ribosomal protein L25 [Candidatus Omnitrophota bacterium]
MEKIILKAEIRTATGKRVAKDLRVKGIVPANVYKGGKEATNLQVAVDDFLGVLHTKAGENVIITLKLSGEGNPKDKTVVIKEIQRDPIKSQILHVDFNEISLTEELKVNVPVIAKGEPVGVKVDGGILEHVMRELQVECLPTAIPEKLEVDVSALKIGDAIYVKNVVPPEGVKILNDGELIVLIVKPPKVEVPKEEVAAEGAAEPELIRKKKEEEAGSDEEAKPKEEAKPAAKPAAGGKEEKK